MSDAARPSELPRAMEVGDQIALLERVLARLIDWIGKHDSKASVLLGINTALLGVLGTLAGKQAVLSSCALILLAAAVLPLGISFMFIYLGNFPKIKAAHPSLLYFGTIGKLEARSYERQLRQLTQEEYVSDLISQCHMIAQIVATKFDRLQWAYRMLFLSLPFWSLSIYALMDVPAK